MKTPAKTLIVSAILAGEDRTLFRATPRGYVRLPWFIRNAFLLRIWGSTFRNAAPARRMSW